MWPHGNNLLLFSPPKPLLSQIFLSYVSSNGATFQRDSLKQRLIVAKQAVIFSVYRDFEYFTNIL